ncbi:MAG TPA: amino acid adenylation domain-containing protein [Candidatus Kapabacteria bacterium]|nr:amino acid adenylation domain-containing protein [Candidatus Kapabacteria bacterium]
MTLNVFKDMISESSDFDKEKAYWLTKFAGELTKSYFPYDSIKNDDLDFKKAAIEFKFPGDLFSKLIHLTNSSDSNLLVVLSAGLNILLSKYTGNEDIVIGMPILKQEVEGEFLNVLLAQRNRLNPLLELKKFLLQVKQTINEANENSNYPVERLEYYLGLAHQESGSPLFETVILLQNIHERKYIEKMNHNMVFIFNRSGESIAGVLEYNNRLYKQETAVNIVSHLTNALTDMVNNLNAAIGDVDILSEKERETLLVAFNNTSTLYPDDMLFHELFEARVKMYPDNKAVTVMANNSDETISITYAQLNERANRLARFLRKKAVTADTIVGIMLEPSLEMVIGIMAVSKAGGGFLPVDPESPSDRMEYILQESNCGILLTQELFMNKINFAGEIINIENENWHTGLNSDLERISRPQNLFYTIYTSGTTGRPKGGLLTHRNIVNYVSWFTHMTEITAKDRTILTSSYSFDLGYSIFLGSLATGGELHLIPKESYINPEKLLNYINNKRISYLKMTPSLFSVIVNSNLFSMDTCSSLRLLVLGGEEINTPDVEKVHKICDHIKFMNHYGPTETTIGCISRFIDFTKFEEYKENPTIGKPIDNTHICILDKHFRLLPVGVPGELFIGGAGVAAGYLNRPELTAEKFVTLPANKDLGSPLFTTKRTAGSAFYRTGDLARWTADGNIQFLGRQDSQVKIRGFRIELREIENQILNHPGVKDAVVQAIEDKGIGKFLCAYIVPADENRFHIDELKKFLATNLPDFMIPSHFVSIEKIPLTANGKLDRKALMKIEISWGGNTYSPPENEDQSKMLEIWSEVLEGRIDKIGINDNFFELGGHSLNVMFLISKIHKEFNVKIALVDVFKFPTAAGLVKYIKESGTDDTYKTIELQEAREYYPLSSAQRRFYLAQQLNLGNTAYFMTGIYRLAPDFDQRKLEPIFYELIGRHESLRTSFRIINNEPVQIIHENVEFKIDYQETQEENVSEKIKDFIKPFALTTPPLLKMGLINTGRERILVLNIHHIISDGLSLQILIRDFNSLLHNQKLTPLRVQYKDYALWQNHWLAEKSYKKMEQYWLNTLENFKVSRLPVDNPGITDLSKGNHEQAIIEENSYIKINDFCNKYKITRFSYLVSLFLITLAKETGEKDLTIGIPVENRDHADLENIIGVFLNVFLLRTMIDEDDTLKNNVLKINDKFVEAYDKSTYPYEELYYRIRERFQLPDEELFTILFNYLAQVKEKEVDENQSDIFSQIPFAVNPKYPLTVYIKDSNEQLIIQFVYRGDLYSKNRIVRIIHNYLHFIENTLTLETAAFSELRYQDPENSNSLKEFEDEFENDDLF